MVWWPVICMTTLSYSSWMIPLARVSGPIRSAIPYGTRHAMQSQYPVTQESAFDVRPTRLYYSFAKSRIVSAAIVGKAVLQSLILSWPTQRRARNDNFDELPLDVKQDKDYGLPAVDNYVNLIHTTVLKLSSRKQFNAWFESHCLDWRTKLHWLIDFTSSVTDVLCVLTFRPVFKVFIILFLFLTSSLNDSTGQLISVVSERLRSQLADNASTSRSIGKPTLGRAIKVLAVSLLYTGIGWSLSLLICSFCSNFSRISRARVRELRY